MNSFEEANKVVHPVEKQWHFPFLTKFGFEAVTKEDVGFVRMYTYKHPRGEVIHCHTGMSRDYWEHGKTVGLWSDLEIHLQSLGL